MELTESNPLFSPDQPEHLWQFRKLLRESEAVESFIKLHLQGVSVDVERAGTPKGQTLPFARKKTRAALLHLKFQGEFHGFDELARAAGVSYSLLGKWRTEERFKNEVEKYTTTFSMLVVG